MCATGDKYTNGAENKGAETYLHLVYDWSYITVEKEWTNYLINDIETTGYTQGTNKI